MLHSGKSWSLVEEPWPYPTAFFKDVLDSCCNRDASFLLHFECFIPANHESWHTVSWPIIHKQINPTTTWANNLVAKSSPHFPDRKSGETFGDSLAKFRGLQELCQSLGVRVGPVLLNRASTKVLFLGFLTAGIDDKIRWVVNPEVHRIHRIRWNLITCFFLAFYLDMYMK